MLGGGIELLEEAVCCCTACAVSAFDHAVHSDSE